MLSELSNTVKLVGFFELKRQHIVIARAFSLLKHQHIVHVPVFSLLKRRHIVPAPVFSLLKCQHIVPAPVLSFANVSISLRRLFCFWQVPANHFFTRKNTSKFRNIIFAIKKYTWNFGIVLFPVKYTPKLTKVWDNLTLT